MAFLCCFLFSILFFWAIRRGVVKTLLAPVVAVFSYWFAINVRSAETTEDGIYRLHNKAPTILDILAF